MTVINFPAPSCFHVRRITNVGSVTKVKLRAKEAHVPVAAAVVFFWGPAVFVVFKREHFKLPGIAANGVANRRVPHCRVNADPL